MPWLVTYADMATLLLAFFVLLYTVSKVDQHRYEQIVRSLTETLTQSAELSLVQEAYFRPIAPPIFDMGSDNQPITSLLEIYEALKVTYREEVDQQQLQMAYDPDKKRIQLVFPELVAFDLGSADLQPRFVTMLRKFSNLLRGHVQVKVIGHSDRLPIIGGRFRSNWELSGARAAAVIEQFVRDGVIHPEQAMAIGLADTQPISKGNDMADFAMNRRVEILIEPLEQEPVVGR